MNTATKTIIQGIPMSHIAIALSVMVFMLIIPALVEPKKFREALEQFFNSSTAVIRLAAFIHLFIAFLILNTHWTIKFSSTRSIMTVIGYLLLLKGIVWFWFPAYICEIKLKLLRKKWALYAITAVGLIFALGFGYLGIWVY